jgi:signal transduction histidine kinase
MTSTGPLAFAPWSARAWRDTTFVTAGVPVQLAAFVVLIGPWTVWVPVTTTEILLALAVPLALILVGARALTAAQRGRFWALLGMDVPSVPAAGNARTWRGAMASLRSEATWRQVTYHLVAGPVIATGGVLTVLTWAAGFALATVFTYTWALPIRLRPAGWTTRDLYLTVAGVLLLLAAPWMAAGVTRLDSRLAAALLGPSRAKELQRRVEDLTESRAGVVDAADTERRRIERDLHDGAQQRLVSLALNLGIARETLTDVPDHAMRVIVEAHEEAKEALTELRDLVRGLHPAVLDARGLDAALSGIAARAPLPVRLRVDVPERASPTVEAVAYFVASEALTNVSRHARASHMEISVERLDGVLRMVLSDDGVGGADPAGGTGLAGLARRVRSVDGTFRITSPTGGPTIITAELPCES